MKNTGEKIVIIGYGWVGQANALALFLAGNEVYYYDPSTPLLHYEEKYENEYKKIPRISTPLEKDSGNTWYIVCVGDRVQEDGVQDLSLIREAISGLENAKGGIILRSTVLPHYLSDLPFDYYMPEFLHEKYAVEECIDPFYFVLGKKNTSRREPNFLKEWEERSYKIFKGTPEQASYIKYLSNIWHATRVALVNEFGDILYAPKTKKDVKEIHKIIDFVFEKKSYGRYGKAYSGHCLPKDVLSFMSIHANEGHNVRLIQGVHNSNVLHKSVEEKYQTLPEWFSAWDYGKRPFALLHRLWRAVNRQPIIRFIRRRLRFIKDAIQQVFPERSLDDVRRVWDTYGKKHPYYFMNTATRSGKRVTEEELRDTGWRDYVRHVSEDEIIRELLSEWRDKEVLEIGCGIGRMTECIAKDFKRVYAVDISDEMIGHAKKRLYNLENVHLVANDGRTIPFEKQFDFIFSYSTLSHLPQTIMVEDYFVEIYKKLKDGGVAKIHLRTGPPPRKWRKTYGVSLRPEEARNIAEEIGLRVLRHEVEDRKNLWLVLKK